MVREREAPPRSLVAERAVFRRDSDVLFPVMGRVVRTDPLLRRVHTGKGHAPAKKPSEEAVSGGNSPHFNYACEL